MVGGRIGDDNGSSPWAVKIKTHTPYGGVVRNISFVGVRLGRIAPNTWQMPHGGTAFYINLTPYNNPPFPPGAPQPAASSFVGITLQDIFVTAAVNAGDFGAVAPLEIQWLALRNVTFGAIKNEASAWSCSRLNNTVAVNVTPPLPPSCF